MQAGEGAAGRAIPALSLILPLDPDTLTYRMEITAGTLTPDTYRLQLLLESATFKRQLTRSLRITGTPLEIHYEPRLPAAGDIGPASLDVRLQFDAEMIRPGSLFGYLRLQGPGGADAVLEFNALSRDTADYELPIDRAGTYTATTRLRAETVAGEPLVLELPEESFSFDFDDGRARETPLDEGEEAISWTLLAAVVGGGTLAFAALITLVLLITREVTREPGNKAAGKGKAKKKPTKATKDKKAKAAAATEDDAE
jgi:hypothetical protein